MKTKIDNYFYNKGIKTIFNCLGNNEKLVRAYISNFHEDTNKHVLESSQYTKLNTYGKLYTIQPRKKMTGFELVKDQDNKFRNTIQKFIVEPQFSPLLLVENNEHDSSLNYKECLKEFVKNIDNPLLYLSGGADSELVACAMLEANIKFNVVIFEWLNDENHIINSSEIFHAYRFCKNHGIIPTIKQVNVEKLWSSDYFRRLAIDLQLQSTHLVTYAHAINVMSLEYTNSTHVFGGEVKFRSNYYHDNGEKTNLVFLDKTVPGYDGQSYTDAYVGGGPGGANARLMYLGYNGNWAVQGTNAGTLASGTWTTTPAVQYEYRISQITIGANDGSYNLSPGAVTSYGPIGQALLAFTQVCAVTVSQPSYGQTWYATVTFFNDVRVVGETTPVQSSSITLTAAATII